MNPQSLFFDDEKRLRSGWRVGVFVAAFVVCVNLLQAAVYVLVNAAFGRSVWKARLDFIIGAFILFASAALIGWACGAVFEKLPFRSLGWSLHRGWFRNAVIGTLVGALSLLLAAAIATISKGLRFSFDSAGVSLIAKTLFVSAVVFVFAAAAEEVLFRGYQLQTLTRANLAWLGVALTSVEFAAVHLQNPNVVPALTFVNTALAGVWLAVAYLRTRSLWFPLGIHWSWNWVQGSLLGLPVSGISSLTRASFLHATNTGPDWLTGGAYGIEGGAACSIALVISTLVIWRLKLIARADVPTKVPSSSGRAMT
jgi:membrane protease YdiL (CAAX protease family)